MKNRVVITGLGAITPLGNNIDSFWNNIKNGVVGIDFIKGFDTANFKAKLAAEVKDFNPEEYIEKKEARRMDKFCQFAIAASQQAVDDSKLDLDHIDKNRFGVIVGSGIGGIGTIEKEEEKLLNKGPNRISPLFIPMIIGNMAAGNIAIRFGAKAICNAIVTACATGTNCIGEAFRVIKNGEADIMIAGGAEASITPVAVAGFTSLTALSKSTDPKRASIPFDKERDGFIMGEGSGILILESLEHAKKRGAKIYGEIVGYGATCDAYHMTSPAPKGEGASRAMNIAIKEADINKEKISYINAHGTGTFYNDKFETEAIKEVFESHAYNIPISSTKSMTGHLLGAAGAVEAIVCVKSLEEGFIPPTVGYKVKDEECDLDYVIEGGRQKDIEYAMSNSLGFGGHNAIILLRRWSE
ncbi:beta-ketoacyl-ACP synthase II [Clostridium niameyense]|uniref:3-oxoacyl-[acyl-carrier-protein] synthase 2 n=1 Tax=Clostridium niameyense TaxID=1622073 RepID=A0A6M0RDH9_9CLOT|nr:beta-ketoacyl-ACP synthase II [Clostridium niameyense]NEZ47629.1 beta-ketoacyl-ACP synthase II [Clostridium niameyense]